MAKAERAKTEKPRKAQKLPRDLDRAISAAEDKKAEDMVVLDLRKAGGFTDYFVICSGANPRQIRAIADSITDALADSGTKPAHVEGYDRSEWILIDCFDFIIHVFARETRMFYGLERLWGNAERVEREEVSLLRAIADALVSVLVAPRCVACCVCSSIQHAAPCARAAGSRFRLWRLPSVMPAAPTKAPCGLPFMRSSTMRGARLPAGWAVPIRARCGGILSGADAAVPVPLHASRHRERGFNQAADLAKHLGLPVVHALRRLRATRTQADLPASERHLNVIGAFAVKREAAAILGKTVVLVDDVRTTGSTLEACAMALEKGGVREVRTVTAARVLTKPR